MTTQKVYYAPNSDQYKKPMYIFSTLTNYS